MTYSPAVNESVNSGTAKANADRGIAALTAAGYNVEAHNYPPMDSDIGARHYALVTIDGFRYSAQWHKRAPYGTSFMRNRGDGWDETIAQRLSTIVTAAIND